MKIIQILKIKISKFISFFTVKYSFVLKFGCLKKKNKSHPEQTQNCKYILKYYLSRNQTIFIFYRLSFIILGQKDCFLKFEINTNHSVSR